jgi:hypothetical protein
MVEHHNIFVIIPLPAQKCVLGSNGPSGPYSFAPPPLPPLLFRACVAYSSADELMAPPSPVDDAGDVDLEIGEYPPDLSDNW